MLQLQQIQAHGKRMLIEEKRIRNQKMFQMQEKRTHFQGLQGNTVDEEMTSSRRIR